VLAGCFVCPLDALVDGLLVVSLIIKLLLHRVVENLECITQQLKIILGLLLLLFWLVRMLVGMVIQAAQFVCSLDLGDGRYPGDLGGVGGEWECGEWWSCEYNVMLHRATGMRWHTKEGWMIVGRRWTTALLCPATLGTTAENKPRTETSTRQTGKPQKKPTPPH
jgi:hypothetical protein